MKLKAKILEEFKLIIQRDYGISLADEDANLLGTSLLRLSRLAIAAIDRAEDKNLIAKSIIN